MIRINDNNDSIITNNHQLILKTHYKNTKFSNGKIIIIRNILYNKRNSIVLLLQWKDST